MIDKNLKNDLLESFKELYFFEFQRKDSINSGSNFLLALSVIYGSIIVFYLNSLPILNVSLTNISFYILLALSLILFCLSLYHFRKFLSGLDYQYISYPHEILQYLNNLSEYNKDVTSNKELDIPEEFLDFMIEQTSTSAETNSEANNNKISNYNSTIRYLLISLLLLMITSVPFFINKYENNNSSEENIEEQIQTEANEHG
jgi:hypothetical protein